jgi:hypothetical protein
LGNDHHCRLYQTETQTEQNSTENPNQKPKKAKMPKIKQKETGSTSKSGKQTIARSEMERDTPPSAAPSMLKKPSTSARQR